MLSSCPLAPKNIAIATVVIAGCYFTYRYIGSNSFKAANNVAVAAAAAQSAQAINAIVISGPSGVGKGTLIDRVKKEYASAFAVSVSHTSRQPRAGEVNGQHYHFSDKDTMTAMDAKGEFLEICNVHGNLYGTSIAALDAVKSSGKVCIIEVDVQGSQKIKRALANSKSDLNVAYMFIAAPSLEELEKRIAGRGGEDEEKIKTRLQTARSEMNFLNESADHFDFVLVNDNLEKSYAAFVDFLKKKGALKY